MFRSTWIVAAAAAAAVTGAAPAAARADACAADARHSYARVELFRDGACTGSSVSVGFTGSGRCSGDGGGSRRGHDPRAPEHCAS